MKRFQSALRSFLILILLSSLLFGCATPPQEPEPEPPSPPPAPAPEPEPEPPAPEPRGTAPLVGTLWELTHQYASEEIASPPRGTVRLRFTEDGEQLLQVEGPVNRMVADYGYAVREKKSGDPNYEEGTLSLSEIARTRRSGPHIRYEDLMVSNLELVQGYYITGERPLESTLTIFGGYGREEIILFELRAVELPPD
ncbi:MAG: hypothetical protein ACLFPW_04745 [Spirochaetaceae bacterium]